MVRGWLWYEWQSYQQRLISNVEKMDTFSKGVNITHYSWTFPSIHDLLCSSFEGHAGSCSQSQLTWTGRQRITTYRDKQPFTSTVNLEFPVNLNPICMCMDCGRKPEEPLHSTHKELGFELGRWRWQCEPQHHRASLHGLVIAVTQWCRVLFV